LRSCGVAKQPRRKRRASPRPRSSRHQRSRSAAQGARQPRPRRLGPAANDRDHPSRRRSQRGPALVPAGRLDRQVRAAELDASKNEVAIETIELDTREEDSLAARPAGMPTQAVTQLALSQARRAEARRYAMRRREARSLRARLAALLARAR
jgi:hypothetical protein